ncbi:MULTISPECIES: HU family DNA-binding protein [Pseudoalteromonas]|uniref:Integration host factor subunit alpha n=1 Tax=Pseudoalteromonas peptidolytica F12-50-A1 TaxID=1315280 RepID=A0A8I0T763_9GAMM|nr:MULTISPECIES: HU family DNA-binding protein [Pseudoalteromonas]MBE0347899.1 hypothetical protein [Pseudoalteromonas peptidolytica F12-50-A1]MDW7551333.1 HU family DNA-binding protein [Pseudoalteromonas peptidolytica]GEK08019.1 integration host factor subunit alpha [Pseudoalteromonas peptidolytica]
MAISKTELADHVADAMKISKTDARGCVNAVIDAFCDALQAGQDVRVQGFGTLKVVQRNARLGRNPSTKEPVPIDACNTVQFKVSQRLKELLPNVK